MDEESEVGSTLSSLPTSPLKVSICYSRVSVVHIVLVVLVADCDSLFVGAMCG